MTTLESNMSPKSSRSQTVSGSCSWWLGGLAIGRISSWRSALWRSSP